MTLSARSLTIVLALQALASLTIAARPAAAAPQLTISEFRLRGPAGALDEFIEIYNPTTGPLTIASSSGSGYGVVASDGVLRCTIPNGTVIPAHGHFLCVNTGGYSLGAYPSGAGGVATGDAGYTLDIIDNAGIALFNNNAGSYTLANRLDAVGSFVESNTLYREGAGYPPLAPVDIEHAFTRRMSANAYVDTNVNKADFQFVDTNGTSAGAGTRRGAPGPENLSSPIVLGGTAALTVSALDECRGVFSAPNRVRSLIADPANNSRYGTVDLRTTWTNTTGANITRLRFRVLDLASLPAATGVADLRPRSSSSVTVTIDAAPCGSGTSNVAVMGTTLEEPPSQPEAGGLNSSLAVGVVTPGAPLADGTSVNVRFLLGVEQTGSERFCVVPETVPASAGAVYCHVGGQLIVSEFRLRGRSGASDEFIEVYNASGADHRVSAASGSGYGVAASDGVTRCTIPNGTVIPDRGHFLCVNTTAYSLGSYPSGGSATATGDAGFTTDIPDNTGIAVFNNNTGGGSYAIANRLDAVGPTTEANALYREGPGYNPIAAYTIDASLTRRPAGGCSGSAACNSAQVVQSTGPVVASALVDTDANVLDFIFVDTNGTYAGFGQRLGAPGPENLAAPVSRDGIGIWTLTNSKLDSCAALQLAPNTVRDLTPNPSNNSSFGTLDLRRSFTNSTGAPLTRLRFRIVDITTFPSPTGVADLRPLTSASVAVTVDGAPCGSGTSSVTVQGTTLEQPPTQPNGSGYNGSLSVAAVSPATPLADGASVSVRFVLGLQQKGAARFCVIPETLPGAAGQPFCYIGGSEAGAVHTQADFDNDRRADVLMYNRSGGSWPILRSNSGFTASSTMTGSTAGAVPMPGDYDGDGRLDSVAYLPMTGVWRGHLSSTNYTRAFQVELGGAGYMPVPGDYDGDGQTDAAVFQPVTAQWHVHQSSSGDTIVLNFPWPGWGATPVGGQDFDLDGKADPTVYSETSAAWTVLLSGSNYTSTLTRTFGGVGYTLVPGDYDGDRRADFARYQRSTGAWSVLTSTSGYVSTLTYTFGGPGYVPLPADYDGDGRIDLGLYQLRDSGGTTFHALTSSTSYASAIEEVIGVLHDVPVSAAIVPASRREHTRSDYNADFRSDMVTYNASTGVWRIVASIGNFTWSTSPAWGGPDDSPVLDDFDGDGVGDLASYRASTGVWSVRLSGSPSTPLTRTIGGPAAVAVAGDYDGDRKADIATYNTTSGEWLVLKSSTGFATTFSVTFGGPGYTAVPGDYDGDGRQDVGIYQASTGRWGVLTSSSNYESTIRKAWGDATFAPVAADFDGDGFTDFAVFSTTTGEWSISKSSSGGTVSFSFGHGKGATPVAGDWDSDGKADLGVYTADGTWFIRLSTSNYLSFLKISWASAPGFVPVQVFP